MTLTTIIVNFNYGRFLEQAIESLEQQTRPPDKIIVVDDGSTDNSLEILRRRSSSDHRLSLIEQANGGQWKATRRGLEEIDDGIVTFLDADDYYLPGHCARMEQAFLENPSLGLVYADHMETSGERIYSSKWPPVPVGPNSSLTCLFGARFGTITSALAMEAELAKAVIDVPEDLGKEWITRADDILIFGASFAGAVTLFTGEASVAYRIHGDNAFAGQADAAAAEREYQTRRQRLFGYLGSQFGIDPATALQSLASESKLPRNLSHPVVRKRYTSAIWRSRLGIGKKIRSIVSLACHRETD